MGLDGASYFRYMIGSVAEMRIFAYRYSCLRVLEISARLAS